MADKHIYRRKIDPDGSDSLARVARLIQPGSTVLDVGTGTGALGQYLSETRACMVDGVNYCVEEVELARPFYRELKLADIEREPIETLFADRLYDHIVCADVLEHLREPGKVLEGLLPLLEPQGNVLISVPNIGYIGALANLLAGEFAYTEEGLLDSTHVRFFTRKSLLEFLASHGFTAVRLDHVTEELQRSEFHGRYLDAWPPAVTRFLLNRPGALAYQFIVEAQPAAREPAAPSLVVAELDPELHFSCELLWRYGDGEFTPLQVSPRHGVIGSEHQSLVFDLPAAGSEPITALRLDPADRPGIMHLHALRGYDRKGELLWQWSGDHRQLIALGDVVAGPPAGSATGAVLHLCGDAPSLLLPISTEILLGLAGGRLECELSWPMSADFLAIEAGMVRDWADARMAAETLQQKLRWRETEVASLTQELEQVTGALEEAQHFVRQRESDLASVREGLAEAQRYVRQRESEVTSLMAELQQVSDRLATTVAALASATELAAQRGHEIQQLSAELDALRASLSWRITAPLRWLHAHASALLHGVATQLNRVLNR